MNHELTMEFKCVAVGEGTLGFQIVNTYDQPTITFFDVDPEVVKSFVVGDLVSFNIAASIERIDRRKET